MDTDDQRIEKEEAVGRVLLCTGEYAKTPYHFNSVCMNVYCVEELCYLFSSNPFMIDTEIMDKELAEWLDRECGLTELSHQLLTLFRRGSQPSVFVFTILDYVNYCTQEEKDKIQEILQSNVGLNDYERVKKQGDFLVKNKRYRLAIEEYDRLLRGLPEKESELRPSIYHNMGVAYSGLFQFEDAARCLRKAYVLSGNVESGLQFLTAVRRQLSDSDYVAFIADHGEYYELSLKVEKLLKQVREQFEATQENRMLSALKIFKEEGNAASYYEEIDKVIDALKDDYRNCVTE